MICLKMLLMQFIFWFVNAVIIYVNPRCITNVNIFTSTPIILKNSIHKQTNSLILSRPLNTFAFPSECFVCLLRPIIRNLCKRHMSASSITNLSNNSANLLTLSSPNIAGFLMPDLGNVVPSSFVRGHKCWFNDAFLADGNLCLLIRGADSAYRMLYPLEIQTNSAFLPGADVAMLMFNRQGESMDFAMKNLQKIPNYQRHTKNFSRITNLTTADALQRNEKFILNDLQNFHRILQYAVAVNLLQNFINVEAIKNYPFLYENANIDYKWLISSVSTLKEFYSTKLSDRRYKETIEPTVNEVLVILDGLWHSENFISKISNKVETQHDKHTYDSANCTKLYVDINDIKPEDIPDKLRDSVMQFVQSKNEETK